MQVLCRKTIGIYFWMLLLQAFKGTLVASDEFQMIDDRDPLPPATIISTEFQPRTVFEAARCLDWESVEGWHRIRFPEGLLYRSNLAGPKEPRNSIVTTSDREGNIYSDATLGGRVGFLRFGTPGAMYAQGWQWDFEGAVVSRMNHMEEEDLDAADYRFGTSMTCAFGPWSHKFGYSHWSSHVGDELLVRTNSLERINYVTESLVMGTAYQWSEPVRLYGEMAIALKRSGGAKPVQFQVGAEYASRIYNRRGIPFAATNVDALQALNFEPNITVQTGWLWNAHQSGRRMRFGLQLYNGRSNQYSFIAKREQSYGLGLWYDY
ncbi:MAG: DUF1207 domain-containing protein [Pirellulaceae bacterium]